MIKDKINFKKIISIIIGLVAVLYLFFQPKPQYYEFLLIIPLVYVLMNLTFSFVHTKDMMSSVFGVMFNGIMFLRAVIMPVVLGLGGFAASRTINIEQNMPIAIILFSYEMIFEYVAVYVLYNRKKILRSNVERNIVKTNYKYLILIFFLIIGLVTCYLLAPMAINYYRTIFGITDFSYTGFDSRDLINEYATSTLRKFGLVTFRYIANVSRLVIPALFIVYLKRKNIRKGIVRLITILLIFIANFLLVEDTIASSLINSIILIVFYNRLYSNPKRIMQYFIIGVALAMAYFSLRLSLTSNTSISSITYYITRFSNILQAYFSGINNISAGLNMSVEGFAANFKYASYEFLKGIPYATTIFGLDSTNISTLFNSVNNTTGQIVPTISSASLYFGILLAPIYGVLFIAISYNSSYNFNRTKKPLLLLSSISITVYALMGISMYSPEATWAFIFTIGLSIRLLSIIFERNQIISRRICREQT